MKRKIRWKVVFRLLLIAVLLPFLANAVVLLSSSGSVYEDIADVPDRPVALVLGAAPWSDALDYRLDKAAELYTAGKVRHLLLSGDNGRESYNEPQYMKEYLVKKGVPDNAMTLDFAGFKTLDSVYRARHVFGVKKMVIVSQGFHTGRAVFLAQGFGIEASGYNARKTDFAGWNSLREFAARTMACGDRFAGLRAVRFTGPVEPIILD